MRPTADFEFPAEQQKLLERARRLEWWSLVYLASTAALLYATMGTSQAMRTSFFEDVFSMLPAIAFLVTSRIAVCSPSSRYPYGYHSAVSIGYLMAALALLAVGGFLLVEAGIKFAADERTTIGGMTLFGSTFWAGWPMLLALAYSCVPSLILGRVKLKLAPQIHDKILFADAKMMKADWMAVLATAFGVVGVGFGWWWADLLAAAAVSIEILRDGFTNIGAAITDLIKERPRKTDDSDFEPLPDRVADFLRSLDWVAGAQVRMREDGHVFFGEAYVVPAADTSALPRKIDLAIREARALDWRLHDLVVMPVEWLPDRPESPERAPGPRAE
jgi:divalent metal cation (Fe/Co/Zn/Cd) transporter